MNRSQSLIIQDPQKEFKKIINSYENAFKTPLPLHLLNQHTQNSTEHLKALLYHYNSKGNELVSLIKDFNKEVKSAYKQLQSKDSLLLSSNLNFDQLKKKLKLTETSLKDKTNIIKDQEDYVQFLKDKNSELQDELETLKFTQNKIQEIQSQEIKDLKEGHKRELESCQNKLKREFDLEKQEIILTETRKLEKKQNKELCKKNNDLEELKMTIVKLKNTNLELEQKLKDQKTKKLKYKNQVLSLSNVVFNKKNLETNAFELIDNTKIDQCQNTETYNSELKELEIEQSSKTTTVNFGEEIDNSTVSRKSIVILQTQRFKLFQGVSFSIHPSKNKKNLNISDTNNFRINPTVKLDQNKAIYAIPAFQVKKTGKASGNFSRSPKTLVLSPRNSTALTQKQFSNFKFKNNNLTTESWSESIVNKNGVIEEESLGNIIETSPVIEDEQTNISQAAPNDAIKDYFITLCKKIKENCSYSEKSTQIPTGGLYKLLISHKTPLCMWPDAIQNYLAKRLRV